MVIKREDNRSIVSNFNIDGINAVVGIDLPLSAQVERDSNSEVVTDTGTGSLISPYHVLTAGHVIFGTQQASEVKVRLGQNAADLDSRTRTPLSSGNFDASGTDLSYPLPGYNGGTGGNDLGLITLNESTGEPSQYIGLVTFVDPQDADNLAVTTAGFPGVVEVGEFATNEDGSLNIEDSTSKNAQFLITDENNVPSEFLQTLRRRFYITDAVKMFTASGTIDSVNSEGQLNFSATLDGEAGQSGSGYWTYLEGDSEPRVLGVYSGDRPGGLLLDSNIGALISTEAYDNIVTTMQPLLDENDITGNALPENAIVGSNQSDEIEGTYRRERILGNVGQDTISGGDADDRLEGGFGNDTLNGGEGNDRLQGDNGNDDLDGGEGDIDVAVFSEEYTTENYDYSISEDGEEITISHIGGTRNDGVDTLKNIEWALFKSGAENIDNLPLTAATSESGIISQVASATGSAPRIIPLPLEDGEETTVSQQVYFEPPTGFTQDPVTPPHVSLTAPVSMLDGDIDYTVSISPYKPDTQYNISYIVSTSPRTGGTKLQQVKDALIELNNYFIDAGVAENSNFAVIPFNDQAYLYRDLTASEASTTIQNLTTFGNYRNRYHSALNKAALFTSQSSLDKDLVTNIAYFIADGKSNQDFFDPSDYSYQQDARTLRNLSNVQAFGLYDPSDSGTVTPSQINYVDSNDGVIINDTANLSAELFKSGLAEDVVEVNILLDGEIVETITPEQLTDTPLGLIYEGSIDGLDVSIDAENLVTAEVVFNHTFSNTTVQHTVTAGESQAVDANGNPIDQSGNDSGNDNPFERELEGSDGDDEITLGYVDLGANGGAGGDLIIGNKRDNILNGGDGDDTIFGHGGNDTITPGAGNDKVDGGDGIDTVLYGDVVYQGNSNINLNQAANSVSYNNSDLLTDVEFIQFSDVRLSAETLEITPTLEVAASNLTIAEGSNAQVNFELDTSAPVDIVLNYSTSDLNATAGTDYVATSGQVTIPAGETTATVMVETLEDELYDESGESFSLNLTGLTGATFSNQLTELEVAVIIENLEPPLTLNGTPEDDLLQGGNNDDLIKGKEGNDFIDGGAGQDTLWGNAGDDTIDGGEGSDRLGVKSNNKITLTDTQVTGDGIDTIISVEAANLAGGAGDNQINASKANNIETVIQGNNGNDTLNGGAGNDQLIG
ncbi:MAG: Calx-beta domain-containing protein, partial [Cyanobacteria bacterium P01_A01_bin.40]